MSSEQAQVASITYVANFHGTRVTGAIKTDACIERYKTDVPGAALMDNGPNSEISLTASK